MARLHDISWHPPPHAHSIHSNSVPFNRPPAIWTHSITLLHTSAVYKKFLPISVRSHSSIIILWRHLVFVLGQSFSFTLFFLSLFHLPWFVHQTQSFTSVYYSMSNARMHTSWHDISSTGTLRSPSPSGWFVAWWQYELRTLSDGYHPNSRLIPHVLLTGSK